MRVDVVTLFPEMFSALTRYGVTGRALDAGHWSLHLWDPRSYTEDVHRTVDDRPFGGGPGMILMAEPLARCVDAARAAQREQGWGASRVIALSASGAPLQDARVRELAQACQGPDPARSLAIVLICGRYEGIDQRLLDACVDEQICIGDFVLSGGELPAMCLLDAVVRHLPGTMKAASADEESFARGQLDAPHYTRPESWRGRDVPAVLLSGHHARIAQWRREQALAVTRRVRPDLLEDRDPAAQVPLPDKGKIR